MDTNPKSDNNVSATSDNRGSDKVETDPNSAEIQTNMESIDTDESNIWKEKPTQDVEKTREKEFEEYLADLFM